MPAAAPAHRLKLSRAAGARLPADAVSVAWPTKWHNRTSSRGGRSPQRPCRTGSIAARRPA